MIMWYYAIYDEIYSYQQKNSAHTAEFLSGKIILKVLSPPVLLLHY